MIILTGPSASGKTAACLYLQSNFNIKKVVTHTTRGIRQGEIDGVDYHFVTVEEFQKMVDNNEFVEHVFYNGNHYGTSRKEVGIDKCMAVELNGAKTYKSFGDPKTVLFYMQLDPETCKKRMEERGDPSDKVAMRLKNDQNSFVLTDDMKKMIDCYVDTKNHDIADAASYIYKKYLEILEARGIRFEA